MTKQGRHRAGAPTPPTPPHPTPPAHRGSLPPARRAASPAGPRGGAVARRRPGALRGRGRGRRGGRGEGGGKSAAFPLAGPSAAAPGGDSGSGGSARPGDPHSPAPLRPTRPGPWTLGGGLGGVASPRDRAPRHVTAAPQRGGTGGVPYARQEASLALPGPGVGAGGGGGGGRRGVVLFGGSGSVGRRNRGTLGLREPRGRGQGALEGTERTCVAGGAGPLSGMEGSLPGSRRPPQERERLFVRAGLQLRGAGRNSGPFSSVVPSGGPRG